MDSVMWTQYDMIKECNEKNFFKNQWCLIRQTLSTIKTSENGNRN